MSFDDIRLPLDIERGVKVSPEFAVSRVRLTSGFSRTLLRQNFATRMWNIAYGLQGLTGIALDDGLLAIYQFYMARGGILNSFRMRDWLDFQLVQEVIGTGNDVEFQFQIQLTHTDFGSFLRVQQITKPSNNADDTATIVRVNAAVQTEGVDFDIEYNTGIITFITDEADVPLTACSMIVNSPTSKDLTFAVGDNITGISVGDYVRISGGFTDPLNIIPAEEAWLVTTKVAGQLDFSLITNNNIARDLTLGVVEGPIASGVDLNVMTPVVNTHDVDITVDYDRHVSFEKPINFELALTSVGRVKKISVIEER